MNDTNEENTPQDDKEIRRAEWEKKRNKQVSEYGVKRIKSPTADKQRRKNRQKINPKDYT